jgi:hypothetical protein
MSTRFDFEYPASQLSAVMMERLRARIARRPGRWRRRMKRQRKDGLEQGVSWETRRAA